MRLGIDELGFFAIFIAFTLFMITIVEGIIPKLFFLYWMLSVSACAIYIIVKKKKIYCLWYSCKNFDPQQPDLCKDHDEYICVGKPDCSLSLEEAKKKYPDCLFCEDWEKDNNA